MCGNKALTLSTLGCSFCYLLSLKVTKGESLALNMLYQWRFLITSLCVILIGVHILVVCPINVIDIQVS